MKKNLIKKLSIGVASLALVAPLVLGGMNAQPASARVTPVNERPNANGALKSSVDFISPRKAYNQGVRDGIKDARYYNTYNGVEVKPIHGFTGTADGVLEVHGRVIDAKSVANSKREYKVDYANWLKGYTRSYDQHEHDGVKFGVNGNSVTTFGAGSHLSQGHEKATNVRKHRTYRHKNTARKHVARRNHSKRAKRTAKKSKVRVTKRTRRHAKRNGRKNNRKVNTRNQVPKTSKQLRTASKNAYRRNRNYMFRKGFKAMRVDARKSYPLLKKYHRNANFRKGALAAGGADVYTNGKTYGSKHVINEDWNDIYSEQRTEYHTSFERL